MHKKMNDRQLRLGFDRAWAGDYFSLRYMTKVFPVLAYET